MQDIIVFIQQHMALCVLMVVVLGYVLWLELRQSSTSGEFLSAQAAVRAMNQEHALVWDIRDAVRFDAGHIVGARHVPMDALQASYDGLSKADRNKPLIVVCQKGISAQRAAKLLKDAGHARVHVLTGGIEQWQREQMPLVTTGDAS